METNALITQWIGQMADRDEPVAFYASQCLQEAVLHVPPADAAAQAQIAGTLGAALVAQAKSGPGGARGAASFRGNAFLAAAATEMADPLHPPRVRNHLARMLGYLPVEASVAPLASALQDLEVREMARQSLEGNPSERATEALVMALSAPGPVFCTGVLNSLARRGDAKSLAAVKRFADDPQPELRLAALTALAAFPDASVDAVLETACKSASLEERRTALIARTRLAATLRKAGNKAASDRICQAILASDAAEPQKKAARLALGV